MNVNSNSRAVFSSLLGISLTWPPFNSNGVLPATALKLAGGHSSYNGPSISSQFNAKPGTPFLVALALPLHPGLVRIKRVASGLIISFFFKTTSHSEICGSGNES